MSKRHTPTVQPTPPAPGVTIGGISIKQDSEGRYCLNDLHRAAGGEQKHQPNRWLRSEQAQELTEVISKCPDLGISPLDAKRGNGGGTFVCKEMVYAYAMWISPEFQFQVIRAYDALVTGAGYMIGESSPILIYAFRCRSCAQIEHSLVPQPRRRFHFYIRFRV